MIRGSEIRENSNLDILAIFLFSWNYKFNNLNTFNAINERNALIPHDENSNSLKISLEIIFRFWRHTQYSFIPPALVNRFI